MFLKAIIFTTICASFVACEPPVYGVPFNNNNNNNNNNAGYNGGGYNGGGYNGGGYNGYNDGGYNGISDAQGGGHGVNEANGPVNGHDNNDHHGYGEPKAYEFGYQVKDDHTGTDYNRQEQSDGNQVTGSYRVALPDGRTQIVTYYADWKTGFHADVRYEGEAQYPEVYNTNNNNGVYGNNNLNNQYGVPNNNNNNYNNNGLNNQYGAPNNNGFQGGNVNNQYGAPINPVAINNQYAGDYSSGSSQDFTGSSGYSGSGYDYDSYSSGFGNRNQQPNIGYGAP